MKNRPATLPPSESDVADPADLGAIHDALRNSEARFRAISDVSPLGIFVRHWARQP